MAGLVLIVALGAFAAIQMGGGGHDEIAENPTLSTEPATAALLGFDPGQNQSTEPATAALLGFDPGQNLISPERATPATTKQANLVTEAIAQFNAAGLELPALQIEFYDGVDGCRGHAGLFVPASRNPEALVDRIAICSDHKLIVLHELAHAWMYHDLDDDTRAAFVEHWGLNSWSDSSGPYADRGVERAAQTIAFTVNQIEATDNEAVVRYICGYELLTGSTIEIHTKVDC